MDTAKESGAASAAGAGLRGVGAVPSKIGDVDGERGVLIYQGYNIHDLATNSTFEEVIFLLWNSRLPKQDELDALEKDLRAHYEVPAEVITMMKTFPKEADPMDVLRTAVSSLDFYDKDGHGTDAENATKAAIKMTAQMPTLVAAWEQIRNGKEPIAPKTDLSIATNFL